MPHKLIIFEDNARLRQSLELLLNDEKTFRVMASYPDCRNAIEAIEETAAELIVMDIDMPGMNGVEGVKMIKSTYPDVKVVMHTVFDDDTRIFDSICAGADGYLLKNTSPLQLIRSLEEVMEGGAPMSPFVAQKVFQHFRTQPILNDDFNLTPREKEVLELLVKGNSYKMIANTCSVSIDTVKRHLQNIYHKLHVNCGTEAVAKAIRHRIV
ncbi:MAG: response regulator transcription factor [Chitinophagaceae bacterium]|nr:response regulator transcription factor [Chitinophagaceae bacterium]